MSVHLLINLLAVHAFCYIGGGVDKMRNTTFFIEERFIIVCPVFGFVAILFLIINFLFEYRQLVCFFIGYGAHKRRENTVFLHRIACAAGKNFKKVFVQHMTELKQDIFSIHKKNSLEDYFLSLTSH